MWALLFFGAIYMFGQLRGSAAGNDIPYSEFIRRAEDGLFVRVVVEGDRLRGRTETNEVVVSHAPPDVFMVSKLLESGVEVSAKPENEALVSHHHFHLVVPMLLLIGVWIFFMNRMQGGGRGGAFSFGKSKARALSEKENAVTL